MTTYRKCASRIVRPLALLALAACTDTLAPGRASAPSTPMRALAAPADVAAQRTALRQTLAAHGFTGAVASTLETRLGRRVDRQLADAGRMLWFDNVGSLNDDNTCGGCHSPTNGFGDTQSIAIGIDNNHLVGPHRTGPRNQRRTPMVINTAFYPRLMWNSRFEALSGDPFDNRGGFSFPQPEGLSLSHLSHLLQAQAFIPPTERVEAAGFAFPGGNDDIRAEVLRRVNEVPEYRKLFGKVIPAVGAGQPITFDHLALAIAEFEFTLVFANAPIDRFARGDGAAMSDAEVRGATLFFGTAGCVGCHAVNGRSNEMFSDFREHAIGVPQVAPSFGNVTFDGPGANEDFGLEQVSGLHDDRYRFRTSPLRNVALQPAFMHNGAFVRLEDAIRHHLDVPASLRDYTTRLLAADLRGPVGPSAPLLERLDPLLRAPTVLTDREFADLVAFVRDGLLDPGARPERLRGLVPQKVPSGRPTMTFEFR